MSHDDTPKRAPESDAPDRTLAEALVMIRHRRQGAFATPKCRATDPEGP